MVTNPAPTAKTCKSKKTLEDDEMTDDLPRSRRAAAAMQRTSIQQEMARACVTFRELVERASAEELSRRSAGTRWTNRQLLFHMMLGDLLWAP